MNIQECCLKVLPGLFACLHPLAAWLQSSTPAQPQQSSSPDGLEFVNTLLLMTLVVFRSVFYSTLTAGRLLKGPVLSLKLLTIEHPDGLCWDLWGNVEEQNFKQTLTHHGQAANSGQTAGHLLKDTARRLCLLEKRLRRSFLPRAKTLRLFPTVWQIISWDFSGPSGKYCTGYFLFSLPNCTIDCFWFGGFWRICFWLYINHWAVSLNCCTVVFNCVWCDKSIVSKLGIHKVHHEPHVEYVRIVCPASVCSDMQSTQVICKFRCPWC